MSLTFTPKRPRPHITAESELKVIDFGLATLVSPGEVLNRHVGTPYYIAPEVRYALFRTAGAYSIVCCS